MLTMIFSDYSDEFEFTANGVFRRVVPPVCSECGMPMIRNGFNIYCKGHLGKALLDGTGANLAEIQLKKAAASGIR